MGKKLFRTFRSLSCTKLFSPEKHLFFILNPFHGHIVLLVLFCVFLWLYSKCPAVCRGCRGLCSWWHPLSPLTPWDYATEICSGFLQSSSIHSKPLESKCCIDEIVCAQTSTREALQLRGLVFLWFPAVSQFAPFGHGWTNPRSVQGNME